MPFLKAATVKIQKSVFFLCGGALTCGSIWAQSASFSLPFGTLPSGQDRIRSADGVECQTHVGPRDRWLDMGVYQMGQNGTNTSATTDTSNRGQYVGLYARITFNLDKARPPMDCTELYRLEIERLKMELDEKTGGGGSTTITVQPR